VAACLQRRRSSATAPLGRARERRTRTLDVLYVKALAAPFTVNTMPEATLKALAEHGEVGALLPADGGDCEEIAGVVRRGRHRRRRLAVRLQDEGAKAFVKSWDDLLAVITSKSALLAKAS